MILWRLIALLRWLEGLEERKAEFEWIERLGEKPCSYVFPDHQPDQCSKGFQAAYATYANVVLDQMKSLADKIAGQLREDVACPTCTEATVGHNWRSCLKWLKCKRDPAGNWHSELPGDPSATTRWYVNVSCGQCCMVVPETECPNPESHNYGVCVTLANQCGLIKKIQDTRRGYLNGILDEGDKCPLCGHLMFMQEDG